MPNHFAPVPDEELSPKGPQHAFEKAVAVLAPYTRQFDERVPSEVLRPMMALDPLLAAQAAVIVSAEWLNLELFRNRQAPRVKDMTARLTKAKELLEATNSALVSLDAWSRRELRSQSEMRFSDLEPRWLPSYVLPDEGDFARLGSRLAGHIDEVVSRMEKTYGNGKTADRGGRQKFDERFLGSVKGRFLRDAFEVFDAYHPGSASSSEGSPFFTFVHSIFEFATGEADEDRIAISYKLRELITPLHRRKQLQFELRGIEEMLSSNVLTDWEKAQLLERQPPLKSELSLLQAKFIPVLGRTLKTPPSPKKRK